MILKIKVQCFENSIEVAAVKRIGMLYVLMNEYKIYLFLYDIILCFNISVLIFRFSTLLGFIFNP